MKKIITTFCLLSFPFLVNSQSLVLMDDNFNVVSGTIIDINLPANTHNNLVEILVNNSASTAKTFKVFRTVMNIDALDTTQFCWGGLCYGSTTNTSNLSLVCNPADTIDFVGNGFHAVFNSGTECVTRLVHYQFFDMNNTSDTTGVTLRYLCSTGINEVSAVGGSVTDIYPNPVSTSSAISYKLDASAQKGKFVFYDVLGKMVKQVMLSGKEGTEKINKSDFEAGVYFYSFIVDDKIIATKKLVVSPK